MARAEGGLCGGHPGDEARDTLQARKTEAEAPSRLSGVHAVTEGGLEEDPTGTHKSRKARSAMARQAELTEITVAHRDYRSRRTKRPRHQIVTRVY